MLVLIGALIIVGLIVFAIKVGNSSEQSYELKTESPRYTISAQVTEQFHHEVHEYAARHKLSVSEVIRRAVTKYMQE